MSNPKPFANTERFYLHFGRFYATWTAVELTIDCAIGKILKLTPKHTHAFVGPLEFGRKAAILRSLLPSTDYQNVEEIKRLLTLITKRSLRNAFSHSFIVSDTETVGFVHRRSQEEYRADSYRFTADNFVGHSMAFVQAAHEFEKALGLTTKEIGAFASEAITEEKPEGEAAQSA
jgi:hypothetical protein